MKIHNDPQRSDAWHMRRRGIPTASQFDRIILANGKRSGQARKYMHQLAYERLTGKSGSRDLSNIAHVQHGIDNESRAVAAFEKFSTLATLPVGFLTNDTETIGCSPDRIIMNRHEALEIKCPTGPTHVGYLIDGLEDAYRAQLQGQILIGSFRRVHFFSWHEELPPYYRMVEPDPDFLSLLEKYLGEFTAELTAGIAQIKALGHWPSNTPSVFPEAEDDPPTAA